MGNKAKYFLNKIPFLVKRVFVIFIMIYLGLGMVLFLFQENFIYYPDKTDFFNCPEFKDAEKVIYASSRGYFIKRSPEKVLVFYHGNAGRACDRSYLDPRFAEQNYSTFFVEYSGYSENENKPSMQNLLKNVTDTIDFLGTHNFKTIIVAGESLGVGPASYHALHSNISKLILITPYNNLADLAFSYYPFYPINFLLRNNFTPDTWLSNYKGSVSLILAENDKIIPKQFGQKLYDSLPSRLKKIFIIENAGHNTIYEKDEFYLILRNEIVSIIL